MARTASRRIVSVDFLRGLTVAFMIVANNPGDTMNVYGELLHSHWHGWTAVDFIFPVFLFLVGVSVALAVPRGPLPPGRRNLWPHALKRAAILFLLGLVVNGFPFFKLASLRIPGVLQRIAVVYLATLWLHRMLGNKGAAVAALAILVGYWLLWAFVPVPGLGYPTLDFEYNLEGWLDQMLMRGHIWEYQTSWDPEGVLSTLPCVALALAGVLTGRWLKARDGGNKPDAWGMFAIGMAMHLAGLAWNEWFPINKMITTSSFVLFVGGFAVMLSALTHLWLDRGPGKIWMTPFVALGRNALFIYVVSQLLTQMLYVTRFSWLADGRKSLHFWLFDTLFHSISDRQAASLAWALALLVLLTVVAVVMQRRGVVVKL